MPVQCRCRHGHPADKLCGFRVVGRLARTGVVRLQPLRWLLGLPRAVETCGDCLTLVSLLLPLWARSADGGGVGRVPSALNEAIQPFCII
jgi:hypothetical protein